MKIFAKSALAALALSSIAAAPLLARPMTETDLAMMKRLAAPVMSPDGRFVAFQVRETDMDANKGKTDIYIAKPDDPTSVVAQVASSAKYNEHDPAFSADGKYLYYLSNESGSEQIWRYDFLNQSSTQISKFKNDVAGFKISPDGKKIAVWGDVAVDCFGMDCDHSGDTSKPGPGSGREYDSLMVRHWDEWETPGNHSRIFTYGLNADGTIYGSGHPLDEPAITPKKPDAKKVVGDAPSKPFGGGEEIAWGADSETVYYTLRKADKDEARSTNLDIYSSHQNYDAATNLTEENAGTDTLPSASPDGKYLAWASMARAGYEADRQVLMLMELATGKKKRLTQSWDRSVQSINWAPDSQSLYVTAGEIMDTPVFKIDLGGKVKRLTGAGHVTAVMPRADGSFAYALDSVTMPTELFFRDKKGKVRQFTSVNADFVAKIDPVAVQRFSFTGANGDKVWGQITKPAGAKGRLPVAFLVHGGPQGSFGDNWSFRWNPRVMAAQGYAVVTVDFHGSTGYGQAFTDSINKNWGGWPLEDLKFGLAAAAEKDKQVDSANACALGASYGGYMMNWIAGQWNDGFKCLVNHAGIFDLRSFSFETEELWFDEWDQGGPWWSRTDAEKWNPVNHVTKWRTPTLVIHGEKDFRIPYAQSLATFTALQRQGVELKLLVFPDENHWILKPKNSVQWHRTVFGWLDKHLKKSGK